MSGYDVTLEWVGSVHELLQDLAATPSKTRTVMRWADRGQLAVLMADAGMVTVTAYESDSSDSSSSRRQMLTVTLTEMGENLAVAGLEDVRLVCALMHEGE